METQQLKLETLHRLKGGELAADFDRILASIVADCNARPNITKARTITLKLKLSPNGGTMGLESVDCESQVASSMPGVAHVVNEMQPRKIRGGQMQLAFVPDQPERFPELDE